MTSLAAFIAVIALSQPSVAEPDLAAQKEIYFPGELGKGVKTFEGDGLIVWTNAAVDGNAVLAELKAVQAYLREIFPETKKNGAETAPRRPLGATPRAGETPATRQTPVPLPLPADRPLTLAVYATSKQYQDLWQRVGQHYRGQFGQVVSQGFSYRVFCASSYDSPELFAARKMLLGHELAHVWLWARRGLANDGNWLSEGIATAVQMHFNPASANRADFAAWLEQGRIVPPKRLMDQDRIELKDHWQAGTLVELLIRDHRPKLPDLLDGFRAGNSSYKLVTEVLASDFATLEKQWRQYVRSPPAP